MTGSADLDKCADDIRAAAHACGAMIVHSIINPENVATTRVDSADFPELIAHLRPRLVYLAPTQFDAHEEADEQVALGTASAKRFLEKWKAHKGQTCRMVIAVMADGVLHCVVETTDWLDDFEEEAEALAEAQREALNAEFERAQEAEARKAEAEEKKRLAPYIKKLAADPRFLAPKISAPKRLTLAEALFPDLDRTTIRKVVDRAVNEHWLAGTGA
jgi:hypothetical protein